MKDIKQRLKEEEDRVITENKRVGCPGKIRIDGVWTTKRQDVLDYHKAQSQKTDTPGRRV